MLKKEIFFVDKKKIAELYAVKRMVSASFEINFIVNWTW